MVRLMVDVLHDEDENNRLRDLSSATEISKMQRGQVSQSIG